MSTAPETHTIAWCGIKIEIRYDPAWLGLPGAAHLDITAVLPERAVLPISDTGYRSHFTTPEVIAAAGGPVAFVVLWLDHEAQSAAWKKREEAARQMSLF